MHSVSYSINRTVDLNYRLLGKLPQHAHLIYCNSRHRKQLEVADVQMSALHHNITARTDTLRNKGVLRLPSY